MSHRPRASRRTRPRTTVPAYRAPRAGRPSNQPPPRRRGPWLAAAAGVLLLLALISAVVISRRSGGDEQAATTPTAAATPPRARQLDIDQRLAARDNATDVSAYTAALDNLERKYRQRRDAIADCTVAGTTALAERGISMSALDMLNQMQRLTPEPTAGPIRPGFGLTCEDVVRGIVATTR